MNKFKKILVTGFDKSALDQPVWKQINKISNQIVFAPASDADCLFAKFNKIDSAIIDNLPDLRYIGLLATGTGTVDLKYAKSKNITVSNIPGYSTESVAEWVFGLILEQLRSLEKAKRAACMSDFTGDGFSATEIGGKKFGIVGLGRIGQRVGEIAIGFGAEVYYWSRNRKKALEKKGLKYQSLDKLVATSDILSLHLQTTPDTEGLLNSKRVKSLKTGTLVVNVSGMELVDQVSLTARLKKSDITFIFDHPDEMDKQAVNRLTKYQNCVVYPPIGYITKEARVNKQAIFVSNLKNFLAGHPANQVNP